MNLFSTTPPSSLATKYRPQVLEQFCGQEHLIGEKGVLTKFLQQNTMINALFRGPPGTGKTTLAQLIASNLGYYYVYLNATKSSVAELKKVSQEAQSRHTIEGVQTLLFFDEIHRFNKLQQDALLHDIETGNLILIGATTENPYYHLNNAILSRCLAFEFQPLSEKSIEQRLTTILEQEKRIIATDIIHYVASIVEGDLRSAINRLELLLLQDQNLTLEEVKSLLPSQKSYHKTEDKYDTISALIKSMRGSDPDAAIYRLAKMLAGWEDPLYIARRIVIFAAEDVGLANPQALPLATASLAAAKELGMPEIRIPLAEAVIYLALSPKSNSAYKAINTALEHIAHAPLQPVPKHLTKLGKALYRYPHDFPQHRVDQNYLEIPLQFYTPCENKFETAAQERLKKIKKV